jgi:hypothetical protein
MLGRKQTTASRLERRTDMYVSSSRRFVEGMGGELEMERACCAEAEVGRATAPGSGAEPYHLSPPLSEVDLPMLLRSTFLGTLPAVVLLTVSCSSSAPPEFEAPGRMVSAGPLTFLPCDSVLHDIRDAWEDEAGRIWLLSGYAPHVQLYGEDGRLESGFGARGEGPGELRDPGYLMGAPHRAGVVEVWDPGSRRINRYDTLGTFLSEVHVERMSGPVMGGYSEGEFGEPLRMSAVADGYVLEVYDGQFSTSWHLWRGVLLKLDTLGVVVDTLSVYATLRDSIPSDGPSILGAGPLWTPCGADVAVLEPEGGELLKLSASGEVVGRWPVELPRIPVTRQDVARHVENKVNREAREYGVDRRSPGLLQVVQKAVIQVLASAPEVAPPVRIRCDPWERVWIQTFSTRTDPRGFGSLWFRAPLNGAEREWVRFPDGFQPLHFGPQRIVGLNTDSLGVQVPAWVPFPPGLVGESG